MAGHEGRDGLDAMAGTVNDPVIGSMETLLRRTQVLNGALGALMKDLSAANPLLPFPVMQSRLNHIQSELNECKIAMDQNMHVLARVVLVPTQRFPTKHHGHMLEHLFRTKLEPNVEEWQRQTLKIAAEQDNKQDRERREGRLSSLPDNDRQELWQDAAIIADHEVRKHAWFQGDYTLDEVHAGIENVRHGLKRELRLPDFDMDDDMDDMDDDDDDDLDDMQPTTGPNTANLDSMDLDQPVSKQRPQLANPVSAKNDDNVQQGATSLPMPLDSILRFMSKGQ